MRKGYKFTPEQRKRVSDAHKGIKPTQKQLEALNRGREMAIKNNYIDGRNKDASYRSWQKNQWYVRMKAAEGKFTQEEWETMKAQHDWKCLSCKKREPEIKLTPDHIIPLSKGGSNNRENRQPLCRKCNLQKHTSSTRY